MPGNRTSYTLSRISMLRIRSTPTGSFTSRLARGRHFGTAMGGFGNALLGGWSFSGLFHWTTGLPFSIFPGGEWSTNYNLKGEAIEIGNPGPVGVHMDSQGNPTPRLGFAPYLSW